MEYSIFQRSSYWLNFSYFKNSHHTVLFLIPIRKFGTSQHRGGSFECDNLSNGRRKSQNHENIAKISNVL